MSRQRDHLGTLSRHERFLFPARNAIAAGILLEVEAAVYVVAGSADTWHRKLQVGLLALGPDAWVSHEAAAELHELEGTPDEKVVAFTALRGRRGVRLRNGTVHTTTQCGPHDIITIDGFRCASATRTVLDLAAAGASEHRLSQAIDSAIRLRKSAVVVLERRLATLRGSGRAGVRLLDRLLLDSGGESVLERKFLKLVREHGLPRPKTQCRVAPGPRQVARVDFLYEDERLVVEVSGWRGHSTPSERAKDAQRRNELQDLGFAVYEYTWGDITTRPRWVVDTLRERLQRRRARTVV